MGLSLETGQSGLPMMSPRPVQTPEVAALCPLSKGTAGKGLEHLAKGHSRGWRGEEDWQAHHRWGHSGDDL